MTVKSSASQASFTPLILFSGLAADESVFTPQRLAFPQLFVPNWPVPKRRESMESYCSRIATELRNRYPRLDFGSCVIGGASFGGVIALHVGQHLTPASVLLIGSLKSPGELPKYARFARQFAFLVPLLPVRLLQCLCAPFTLRLLSGRMPRLSGLARQFRTSDPRVFKWSLRSLLNWRETPELACPILRIHGTRDHVIPCDVAAMDHVIEGGGHVISLTHAADVNAFLQKSLEMVRSESPKQ
ncbi:MAG: alpha/beta fold hydrolase [Rubripirellula sp.]